MNEPNSNRGCLAKTPASATGTRGYEKRAPVPERNPGADGVPKDQLVCELEWQRTVSDAQIQALETTRRELEDSRNSFAILFEHAPIAYVTLDRKGHIHETNAHGARLLGYERDKLSRFPLTFFIYRPDLPQFLAHL